jgi:hypothetical protein
MVAGNPWLLYGEERYQKFLLCAEEGRLVVDRCRRIHQKLLGQYLTLSSLSYANTDLRDIKVIF